MKPRLLQTALALCALVVFLPVAAVQRTFVASTGNDANPCSLTLPCRGFAAAVAAVDAGGEVVVLDSAGYGPVIITQSVSIIAPSGIYAGIWAGGTGPGIVVDGAGIRVTLRGLTVTNATFGIRMTNGDDLVVDNCVISHVNTGVSIETNATVNIAGTAIRQTSNGLLFGYSALASITNSQVTECVAACIQINDGVPGGSTNVFISDTLVRGYRASMTACIKNSATADTEGNITATRVSVVGFCFVAFTNIPATGGTMTVSNSVVTRNGYGFVNGSVGTFLSLGNNHVSGNGLDKSGVITTIPPT